MVYDRIPDSPFIGDIADTLGAGTTNLSHLFCKAKIGGELFPGVSAGTQAKSAVYLKGMTLDPVTTDSGVVIPGKPVPDELIGTLIPGAVPYFNPFSARGPGYWWNYQDPTVDDAGYTVFPPRLAYKFRRRTNPFTGEEALSFNAGCFAGYEHNSKPTITEWSFTMRDGITKFSCTIDAANFKGASVWQNIGVRLYSYGINGLGSVLGTAVATTTLNGQADHLHKVSFTLSGTAGRAAVVLVIKHSTKDVIQELPHSDYKLYVSRTDLPDSPKIRSFKVLRTTGLAVPGVTHTGTVTTLGEVDITFSVPSLVMVGSQGLLRASVNGGEFLTQPIFVDLSSNAPSGGTASITNRRITGQLSTPIDWGDQIDIEIKS